MNPKKKLLFRFVCAVSCFHFNREFVELPQLPHRIGKLIVSAAAKRTAFNRPAPRNAPRWQAEQKKKKCTQQWKEYKKKKELRPQIKSKRHKTQLTKYPWLWRNDSSRISRRSRSRSPSSKDFLFRCSRCEGPEFQLRCHHDFMTAAYFKF